jgi:hypothetical protein
MTVVLRVLIYLHKPVLIRGFNTMTVHNNESLTVSDSNVQKGAPSVDEAKLVAKFLDDTNSGMPKTVQAAAKGGSDFFVAGNLEGNVSDLMMAALNDPGKYFYDPRFQAFLKAQRGQQPTDTQT